MANFIELAKLSAANNKVDTDKQLTDLKNQKDTMNQQMAIAIANLELQKNEQVAVENEIKSAQKKDKLKKDMLKMLIEESQGGALPTGNVVDQNVPVEPGAENLPLLA